jgi:hypothetical protein
MRVEIVVIRRAASLCLVAAAGCHGGSPATSSAQNACAPWGGRGFSLKTHEVGGRADFFTDYAYDDSNGVLAVHDSDPFASGQEEKQARITDKSITLSQADRDALAVDLLAICPDDRALDAQCAPGGCAHMDVSAKGESPRAIEDAKTVSRVTDRLARFFPELRKK